MDGNGYDHHRRALDMLNGTADRDEEYNIGSDNGHLEPSRNEPIFSENELSKRITMVPQNQRGVWNKFQSGSTV